MANGLWHIIHGPASCFQGVRSYKGPGRSTSFRSQGHRHRPSNRTPARCSPRTRPLCRCCSGKGCVACCGLWRGWRGGGGVGLRHNSFNFNFDLLNSNFNFDVISFNFNRLPLSMRRLGTKEMSEAAAPGLWTGPRQSAPRHPSGPQRCRVDGNRKWNTVRKSPPLVPTPCPDAPGAAGIVPPGVRHREQAMMDLLFPHWRALRPPKTFGVGFIWQMRGGCLERSAPGHQADGSAN